MRQTLRDTMALLRCANLGTSLSHAGSFVRQGAADTVEAFDRVVAPLLEHAIGNPAARSHAREALLSASVKGGFLICSYAQMIRRPYPAELAALGGSFTRLYDDLIDETDSVRLAERMSGLFHGRPFGPQSDTERLLERLFFAIEERLGRTRNDPLYRALHSLHEWQVLSRKQKSSEISTDSIRQITSGKGGLANVALFALVREAMIQEESDLVIELGTLFQLMDDYRDAPTDRINGISTLVTRGEVTVADLASNLRRLSPRIVNFYGSSAHPFLAIVYILLAATFLKRRRNPTPFSAKTAGNRKRSPLGILLFHGGGALPSRT